jgi:hypothetical protein
MYRLSTAMLCVCFLMTSGCQSDEERKKEVLQKLEAFKKRLNTSLKKAKTTPSTPSLSKPAPASTRWMAWELGGKLSKTALAYSRGLKQDVATRMMLRCDQLARGLGTELTPLYVRKGDRIKDGATALHYIMNTVGKKVGPHLRKRYDQEHADLFELALKSNMLLMLYVPSKKPGKLTRSLVKVIKSRSKRAGLSERYFARVLRKVRAGAPSNAVQDELIQAHKDVASHLQRS